MQTRTDPLSYLSNELNNLRQQGLHRSLRILEDKQQAKTTFDHHNVVNLSSNMTSGLVAVLIVLGCCRSVTSAITTRP